MKHLFRRCCANLIHSLGGSEYLIRWRFAERHGYLPDLKNPRSLSEKLQWIKLHYDLDAFGPFVDKYAVRDFVRGRIGTDHLVPLIGVYERFEDIDFDLLPDSFVIKATHGSSWNHIIPDKSKADWQVIGRNMRRWLRQNYCNSNRETCYRALKGRIIIEEFLEDPEGPLKDYKFYCCEGAPLGLHVDFERDGIHTYRTYDAAWNEFEKLKKHGPQPPVLNKPADLDRMLDICRMLARGFSYVRVDLYYVKRRIYFSELTFLPASGLAPFDPVRSDYYFGEPLDVRKYVPGPF